MLVYRLQPRLKTIDEDKQWLVEAKHENSNWHTVFTGTFEQCQEYYEKHKTHQEETNNE